MKRVPQFLILESADCRKVLDRNYVGRIAFLNQGAVDIEPIGYVLAGDWILLRSAYGAKLEALAHNPFVAFEVDEVKGPFDWRSVVAHGTIYVVTADGARLERQKFERAVAALRRVMPQAFTPDDPTPERGIIFGIHVDRISGRMAQTAPAKSGSRTRPVRQAPKRRSR